MLHVAAWPSGPFCLTSNWMLLNGSNVAARSAMYNKEMRGNHSEAFPFCFFSVQSRHESSFISGQLKNKLHILHVQTKMHKRATGKDIRKPLDDFRSAASMRSEKGETRGFPENWTIAVLSTYRHFINYPQDLRYDTRPGEDSSRPTEGQRDHGVQTYFNSWLALDNILFTFYRFVMSWL